MTNPRPPWKAGNARLREMDRDGALLIKIYCPARHLLAGVMWDGKARTYLVKGDGMGFGFDENPRQHKLYCACSADRDLYVDTGKIWQVFHRHADDWRDRTRRDRPVSLDFEEVEWRIAN